jgi:hypothetical protein
LAIESTESGHPEGHANPTQMPVDNPSVTASRVTVGTFTRSSIQIGKIRGATPLTPGQENLAKLHPTHAAPPRLAEPA